MNWLSPGAQKSLKEFRHQNKGDPYFYCAAFGFLAIESAALCLVSPWLSVAVNGLGMVPLIGLMVFGQEYAADIRKLDHDRDMYTYIKLGQAHEVCYHASRTHYGEKDPEILKDQNTVYLYESLRMYQQCKTSTNAQEQKYSQKYLQAAEIIIKYPTDQESVHARLQQNYPDNRLAIDWLMQRNGKCKLP